MGQKRFIYIFEQMISKKQGSQTQPEDHVTSSFESKFCKYTNPNKQQKHDDSYMKTDPPMWIDVDFEFRIKSVDNLQRTKNIVSNQTNQSRL